MPSGEAATPRKCPVLTLLGEAIGKRHPAGSSVLADLRRAFICMCVLPASSPHLSSPGTADAHPRSLWRRGHGQDLWDRGQVSLAQVGRWGRRCVHGGWGCAELSPPPGWLHARASEPGRRRSVAVPLASARGSQRARRSGGCGGAGRRRASAGSRRASGVAERARRRERSPAGAGDRSRVQARLPAARRAAGTRV